MGVSRGQRNGQHGNSEAGQSPMAQCGYLQWQSNVARVIEYRGEPACRAGIYSSIIPRRYWARECMRRSWGWALCRQRRRIIGSESHHQNTDKNTDDDSQSFSDIDTAATTLSRLKPGHINSTLSTKSSKTNGLDGFSPRRYHPLLKRSRIFQRQTHQI